MVPILYQPLKNPEEPQKWTPIMNYERSYCIKTQIFVERPYQTEKSYFKITPFFTIFDHFQHYHTQIPPPIISPPIISPPILPHPYYDTHIMTPITTQQSKHTTHTSHNTNNNHTYPYTYYNIPYNTPSIIGIL